MMYLDRIIVFLSRQRFIVAVTVWQLRREIVFTCLCGGHLSLCIGYELIILYYIINYIWCCSVRRLWDLYSQVSTHNTTKGVRYLANSVLASTVLCRMRVAFSDSLYYARNCCATADEILKIVTSR